MTSLRLPILVTALAIASSPSAFASSTQHLGEITVFANAFCPKGWAVADGQTLSIQQNAALFSLFGTSFGGNGITTFALPKLRVLSAPANGVAGKAMLVCVSLQGVFPARP